MQKKPTKKTKYVLFHKVTMCDFLPLQKICFTWKNFLLDMEKSY